MPPKPINPHRNEIQCNLGAVKLVLRPSFDRIARMEQALGKSCFQIVSLMENRVGLTAMETAVCLETLQPAQGRVKREEIGAALMKTGVTPAWEAIARVCEQILNGSDEKVDPEPDDLPGEDEELGNDQD